MSFATPRALRVRANDLEHAVLEWGPSTAAEGLSAGGAPRTIVLVHGFMDAAATWDRVGAGLASAGFRVLAPDMRGFGEGARAAPGSYYHFVDYVFDLADLLVELVGDEPVSLVGHSMGGTIATLYAGTFPERVARLALLEGIGPPDNEPDAAPTRMRSWIEQVRKVRARGEDRSSFDHEGGLERLRFGHPRVPEEVLAVRLPQLAAAKADGRLSWRFDPLHRTTSPVPFFAPVLAAFARRVTAPVLFVSGGPEGYHPADEETRLAAFAELERVELPAAGHMLHWTAPDELTGALATFFRAPRTP